MLSIDIKVNGTVVATLQAHREYGGDEAIGQKPVYEYPFRAIEFPLDKARNSFGVTGSVRHRYDDGIVSLAEKLMKAWVKERDK